VMEMTSETGWWRMAKGRRKQSVTHAERCSVECTFYSDVKCSFYLSLDTQGHEKVFDPILHFTLRNNCHNRKCAT
jgi:hypothetical protein